DAGIEVTVGVLDDECRELNRRFITFNEHCRPYITLKWAETANHFIDNDGKALAISTPFTKMLSHRLRAEADAILVGRTTDEREHPQLNTRNWAGPSPRRIVIDSSQPAFEGLDFTKPVVPQILSWLYDERCQWLIVEGGAKTLQSFIDAGAWDEIRIETAPLTVASGTRAPQLPDNAQLHSQQIYDGNTIRVFRNGTK
ncbi:RibD family protein, partial [Prevotella sp.]